MPPIALPELTVCGLPEARVLLEGWHAFTHVVSVVSRRAQVPDPGGARALQLLFDDISSHRQATFGYVLPTMAHVQGIVDFANAIPAWQAATRGAGHAGRLLVHCQAGVGRSPAAAYIIGAALLGPGREQEALDWVFAVRPEAWPNFRMVKLADRILGRGDTLELTLRRHVTEPDPLF